MIWKTLSPIFEISKIFYESTHNFSLVARDGENILEVYQDIISTCPSIQVIETPFEYDSIAISILKFFHPVMLNDFFPSPVLSDGYCLFRAVSKSIYRTEDEHFRLRLLLSLEILKHPEMYDPQTPQFHEYIKDFNAECTTSYRDILEDVSNPGGFTGLIHFYALSTVLNQSIESYYPPCSHYFTGIQCFNRVVYGRDVRHSVPAMYIMWSKVTL